MSQRVETSARALVLTRSSQLENGHLRKNIAFFIITLFARLYVRVGIYSPVEKTYMIASLTKTGT
jgi:hypothetical protein